jgi:hypothetical protein
MDLTPACQPDTLRAKLGLYDSMAKRSGSAILPLHGGRVPTWPATRMSSLGAVVTQAIVHHYGRDSMAIDATMRLSEMVTRIMPGVISRCILSA